MIREQNEIRNPSEIHTKAAEDLRRVGQATSPPEGAGGGDTGGIWRIIFQTEQRQNS